MFFEQAREQAQRAYERDGTDAAVSAYERQVALEKAALLYMCPQMHANLIYACIRREAGVNCRH